MILTVEILHCEPLERLFYCQVTDGKNIYFVISGGKNTRKNLITFLALPGSFIQNTEIQEKTIFGKKSFGMLCSPKDLDLKEEHGLIDLPPKTPLGKPYESFSPHELSSIPWYKYQLIEEFFINEKGVINKKEGKLLSQTYYYLGDYFYRPVT